MRVFRLIILPLVGALILSTAGLVSAQEAGTISGTLTDAQSGDPIQGALVEVEGAEPPLSAETGVDRNLPDTRCAPRPVQRHRLGR